MKGLIRKDFYLLWRYCWLMPLLLLAFIVFSVFSSGGQSPFFIYYPCILSSVIPVNLLAYDDAEHWLTYCDTLPVTRRQYVCGKYIMSLICGGTIFLLSAVAAVIRFCRNGAFCPADLTDQLAVLATISLLSSALTMPPLFGLLANNITPALFPFYLLALLVLMVCMHEQLVRKTRRS